MGNYKIENYEAQTFRKFMRKAELDKALHTLEGILRGITIDNVVNSKEFIELQSWYIYYRDLGELHPFNEINPLICRALANYGLGREEVKDILWVCNNLKTENEYFDIITSDIQRLHGILHGILADNVISDEEILGLNNWLNENQHLTKSFPYDEIFSLVSSVLSDGIISEDERHILKSFFADFVDTTWSKSIDTEEIAQLKKGIRIEGICATCPEIIIRERVFCFTGASSKTTRKGFVEIIKSVGGTLSNNVTKKTDYLVVGDEGNPCWSFSCYGRKVEKAISMRKEGHHILIVHENDFWNTLDDYVTKCS